MKLVIRAFMVRHLAVDGVTDDRFLPFLEDLFFITFPAIRIFDSTVSFYLIRHRSSLLLLCTALKDVVVLLVRRALYLW